MKLLDKKTTVKKITFTSVSKAVLQQVKGGQKIKSIKPTNEVD